MQKKYKFDKRLPKPSIIDGISKMADFRRLKDRYAELINESADYRAILSDWMAVGKDFQSSIDKIRKESSETT